MPGHTLFPEHGQGAQITAAPFGSSLITPISWSFIRSMGGEGLRHAAQMSILNCNYMAVRLEGAYRIAFKGTNGFCAHEFIIDCKPFAEAGIDCTDVAKRLHDYGFHSPTMAWPLENSLMIEPTESEPKEELDRYIEALLQIREEIREVEEGKYPIGDNVLSNAPHDVATIAADEWTKPYTRDKAAFPVPWLRTRKHWPGCARVDEVHGDQNLICSCPPMDLTDL